MDNYVHMQKFVQAASEYLRHHRESNSGDIQGHLQIIASAANVEIFDPVDGTVPQFYASLYELMEKLDSRSTLVWAAIAVLEKACSNPNARIKLVREYKFLSVLSKFLNIDQMNEKQVRLFQIMKHLTYGVQIEWEEAHLRYLVSTLIQTIFEGNNDMKALALEVLVNLCYNNLPVLYVLMSKVDVSKFVKCITKLNESPMIRMHVCKMLIILEQIKGSLPDRDILNFMDVIFNAIKEAFQQRDRYLMRQIVDFFMDVKKNQHFIAVASRYDKCFDDTKLLIQLAEECGDDQIECVAIILDFFYQASFMNYHKNTAILSGILNLSIKHLNASFASLQCLKILKFIAESEAMNQCEHGEASFPLKLSESVPIIVGILNELDAESMRISDMKKKLTCVAALLTSMTNNLELRKQIVTSITCDSVRIIFQQVFQCQSTSSEPVFRPENGELCVKLLSLVAKLANFKAEWAVFLSELLSTRHILMELAITFADGDTLLKYDIFRLAGNNGWSKDSLFSLCDMMSTLRTTAIVVNKGQPSSSHCSSPRNVFPSYSLAQKSQLDDLLDSLRKMHEEGRLHEAATSAIMELYEHKLCALGQTERRTQSALEASDSRCSSLNHQLIQARSEALRLHELLFSYQLSIEGSNREKTNLIDKQRTLQDTYKKQTEELKTHIKQLEKGIVSKEAELKQRVNEQELLLQKIKECENRASNLCLELQEANTALAESINVNQIRTQEIAECKKQIDELERIREIVVNVAAKKDKNYLL